MATLVLGLGNPLLGDDGVGVRLVRDLASLVAGLPGLDVDVDGHIGGLDLAERLVGYDRAVIVDAVDPGWAASPAAAPGAGPRWHHWTAAVLSADVRAAGAHHVNLATALAMLRALGARVPPDADIHLLGVEAVVRQEFREGLSPALEAGYASLREAIGFEVRALAGAAAGAATDPGEGALSRR